MAAKNGHAVRPDPLLAAVIAKLPRTGAEWPVEQQAAWLRMMITAFGVVYGGNLGETLDLPAFLGTAKTPASASKPEPPKPLARPGPRFFIDEQGFARNAAGDQVLASDVVDILYDKRGELGDLGAIAWADGSRGIPPGAQLDISTSV